MECGKRTYLSDGLSLLCAVWILVRRLDKNDNLEHAARIVFSANSAPFDNLSAEHFVFVASSKSRGIDFEIHRRYIHPYSKWSSLQNNLVSNSKLSEFLAAAVISSLVA